MNGAELRFNTALKATKYTTMENIEFISMSLSSQGTFSENFREISKEKTEAIFEEAKTKLVRELALFEQISN